MLMGLMTIAQKIWSENVIEKDYLGGLMAILWRALKCIAKIVG